MRFTLSKSEILRGYKSFTRVITTGKSISAPPIRCFFTSGVRTIPGIQAGFSVSRNFKRAVDRNKAKRFMRESFRLSKHRIIESCMDSGASLDVVFLYTGSREAKTEMPSFKAVNGAMQQLVARLAKEGNA